MARRPLLERAFGWRSLALVLTLLVVGLLSLAGWFGIDAVARNAVAERLEGEASRAGRAQLLAVERRVDAALAAVRIAESVGWVRDLARNRRNITNFCRLGLGRLGWGELYCLRGIESVGP